MKPLRLTIKGLRSYSAEVRVDLTGKGLVGVIGDTGAGKSSLLDAITFALYRKSSWDAREPRALIADGADSLSVELDFLHDGHRWRVRRTMNAKTTPGRHHLTDLDTGEEVDGATAVDNRIAGLLHMGYETFLRVGLLPQGRFDKLLTATPKERSGLLRELFATDSLADQQGLAEKRKARLDLRLTEARTVRAHMPDNPTHTAATARAAADAAEALATNLAGTIEDMTSARQEIATRQKQATVISAALEDLRGRTVLGTGETLAGLDAVAADITARRRSLASRRNDVDARESALDTMITDAETVGEGRDALIQAEVVLRGLGTRADSHRSERARLATMGTELGDEQKGIARVEQDLVTRAERSAALRSATGIAVAASSALDSHLTGTRSLVTAVGTAMTDSAEAEQDHATACHELTTARDLVARLDTAEVDRELAEACGKVDALESRDRAAALASTTHPGDDCPVCRRPVPAGFEPASHTSAVELRTARTRVKEATAARNRLGTEVAEATAAAGQGQKREAACATRLAQARSDATTAVSALRQDYELVCRLAEEAGSDFAVDSALSMLTEFAELRTDQVGLAGAAARRFVESSTALLGSCAREASDRAAGFVHDEHRHTEELAADSKVLEARKKAHERRCREVDAGAARLRLTMADGSADLDSLPPRLRSVLPGELADVTPESLSAAQVTLADLLSQIKQTIKTKEALGATRSDLLVEQAALDREAITKHDKPLDALRRALEAWAESAARARTHCRADQRLTAVERPSAWGIDETRAFAADLSSYSGALVNELTTAHEVNTAGTRAAVDRLRELAAPLRDVDGFDSTADLTAQNALHPLVAAAATARREEATQRKEEARAQALVKPAADLDFAIAAGTARRDALDVLRRNLVDAKFLGHLTALNTGALLGVASDLLGRLTDMRFGFAENFDIVSRGSDVTYTPNRLSGGEKFLASLALSLALAVLHSRSGPRLGALFLDEGFGTLDTTALESALDVLRAQAGSDRLVLVISHLHVVAEAVDDVLWVKRNASGSTAAWLTAAERDVVAQDDLARGLQTLA
ncbi:Exonuclease SbcC [Actinokineospora spheciospongiae]|uniref:Nuclease SbcCD subunit C n=1 Tax=Actinokineospora spheciospongiae TaxID=909613 RepID=W7J607_9PSEU|nr:SMC family ATPase [Actinokineospora spheciospongiae]EWC64447.1 Exonuclease SbcC [Actinokineospora spheciospongiae]PWW60227.1 exonuclease SbcC [Actinokineospora spheciospongiae]